jgi:hypothetical protein
MEKMMPVQIIRLPAYNSSFDDLFAIAPLNMSIEDAIQLAKAIICKKNHECNESDSGNCDDDLQLEESICAELTSMGFGIGEKAINMHETIAWDCAPDFDVEQKAILASYEAKIAISAVLSNTAKPKI